MKINSILKDVVFIAIWVLFVVGLILHSSQANAGYCWTQCTKNNTGQDCYTDCNND